eukprot:1019645-Alexandrium_andersonii.AAC.1
MSASLVGSEMCIRDRCMDVRHPAERAQEGLRVRMVEVLVDREQVGGQRPVSYTHLTLPTICSV